MHAAHPVRSSGTASVDDLAFALCLSLVAVALAARAGFADPGPPAQASPATAARSQQQPAGTFTGAYVDGAPVYRLPAITVRASRQVEMAGIERGDKPGCDSGENGRPAHQG